MGGKACIRDTHVTVAAVVALLSAGNRKEDVIRMLPALTMEDLNDALGYAAWWIDSPENVAAGGSAPVSAPAAAEAPAPAPTVESRVPRVGPPAWPGPGAKIFSEPASAPAAPLSSYSVTTHSPAPAEEAPRSEVEEIDEEEFEDEGEDSDALQSPALRSEESLELFHPAYPDTPTVVVTRHGLFDRRWSTNILAWSDIQEIERVSGHKNINIVLRNPEHYLSSMPFFKRFAARIKLALNLQTFYLDTASLGIRTKDLYFAASRLWHLHRGNARFRKKRRVRIGKKSSRDSYWQKCLPR